MFGSCPKIAIFVQTNARMDKKRTDIDSFNRLFADCADRFIHFAGTYVEDDMAAEDIAIESLMYYWGTATGLLPVRMCQLTF